MMANFTNGTNATTFTSVSTPFSFVNLTELVREICLSDEFAALLPPVPVANVTNVTAPIDWSRVYVQCYLHTNESLSDYYNSSFYNSTLAGLNTTTTIASTNPVVAALSNSTNLTTTTLYSCSNITVANVTVQTNVTNSTTGNVTLESTVTSMTFFGRK